MTDAKQWGGVRCQIEDCGRPVEARGWCNLHYKRWKTHGDPSIVRTPEQFLPRRPLAERILEKIDKTETCWNWRGWLNSSGYGMVKANDGTELRAHRAVYELLVGPIPEGLVIDHLCRNTRCVNPAHLEPVTDGVNVRRGISPVAANAVKTECHAGHPFDEENTYYRRDRPGRNCKACRQIRHYATYHSRQAAQ